MNIILAPYAAHPEKSLGRRYEELIPSQRSLYMRDRDRIIHSAAFRRLQYKTQIFSYIHGDHYRSRLTHTLEVSQIARSLCRNLNLNEDLAEAIALSHDLGHAPFGHEGSDALAAVMKPHGGFSQNDQSFRILVSVENKYAAHRGLNLTWESLEGIAKHHGAITRNAETILEYPTIFAYHDHICNLQLENQPSLEAQIAGIADDIAYNNHDVDDCLRAKLFSLQDLCHEVPLIGQVYEEVCQLFPHAQEKQLSHELIRRLIHLSARDVLQVVQEKLSHIRPASIADIRSLKEGLVQFSDTFQDHDKRLKTFFKKHVYPHPFLRRHNQQKIVKDLFAYFLEHPYALPQNWQDESENHNPYLLPRHIADYIAGMTDRFAVKTYEELIGPCHE